MPPGGAEGFVMFSFSRPRAFWGLGFRFFRVWPGWVGREEVLQVHWALDHDIMGSMFAPLGWGLATGPSIRLLGSDGLGLHGFASTLVGQLADTTLHPKVIQSIIISWSHLLRAGFMPPKMTTFNPTKCRMGMLGQRAGKREG